MSKYRVGDRVNILGFFGAEVIEVAENGRLRVTYYHPADDGYIKRWIDASEVLEI